METLVGRRVEQEALAAAVTKAHEGHATMVLVEGEAGIGKSALLEVAGAAARRVGLAVRAARADEVDRRPLGLVLAVLRQVDCAAVLAQIAAATERTVAPAQDPDVFGLAREVALEAVEREAIEAPVALVFDDLQWADEATIRWIRAIPRRLEGLPILIVVAFRPTPRGPLLEALVHATTAEGAVHLRPQPLARSDVQAVARHVMDGDPAPRASRLLDAAAGNPFLVREVARALADGTISADERALPDPLRASVLRRFASLAPDAIEDIRAAAVLGSTFEIGWLAEMRGAGMVQTVERLLPALSAGILSDRSGRLAFSHDLVRQAVYEEIPLSVRRVLHRAAAAVMAAHGAPAATAAIHAALGRDTPDADTYDHLRAAWRATPELAERVRLLELAADIAPDEAARDAALADLIASLPQVGRSHEVEVLARPLLSRATDSTVRDTARYGLARALSLTGEADKAKTEYETLAEAGQSATLRVWAKSDLARLRVLIGEIGLGADLALEAVADVESLPEPEPEALAAAARALVVPSWVLRHEGRSVDAAAAAQRAVELVGRSGVWRPGETDPVVASDVGEVLSDADRHEEALTVLRTGVAVAERRGQVSDLPGLHVRTGLVFYRLGRLDDAALAADAARHATSELDPEPYMSHALLGRVALHRGERDGVDDAVRSGRAVLDEAGLGLGAQWLLWLLALVDPSQLGLACRFLQLVGYTQAQRVIAPELLRRALELRDDRRASAIVAYAEAGLPKYQTQSARAAALRCIGLGRNDVAASEEAVSLTDERLPLERAGVLEDAATVEAHTGHKQLARDLLLEAARIYEAVGASTDVARLASRGATGRSPRRRATAPATGWEALTPSERNVAHLVAEGLTNRQIGERLYIARSTVHTHLLHVFKKLGCTSRAQVAATAARRQDGS